MQQQSATFQATSETEFKCAALERTSPFKYLPSRIQREAAEACALVSYPVGGVIARKGDTTKDVYIICMGHVHRDYHDGKAGSLLGPGTFFGDRAPLFNEARRVTFTAVRSPSSRIGLPASYNTKPDAPPQFLLEATPPSLTSATSASRSRTTSTSPSLVAVVLLVLPGEVFIDLVMTQLPFASALARMLRTRQQLFAPLDAFQTYLFSSVSSLSSLVHSQAGQSAQGSSSGGAESAASAAIDLRALVGYYKEMRPAVHGGIDGPELDTGAWLYAVRRLPSNITSVSTIVASTKMLGILSQAYSTATVDNPLPFPAPDMPAPSTNSSTVSNEDPAPGAGLAPPGIAAPEDRHGLQSVKTSARRRTTVVIMHGKIFVLLRDSTTDLLDFTTCLCLHTVELHKLRSAVLFDADALISLRDAVTAIHGPQSNQVHAGLPQPPTAYQPKVEPRDIQLDVLGRFERLRNVDVEGLIRMWPEDALWNVWNIVFHHGDYSLFVDRALDSYDSDISEAWVDKVAALTQDLMGDWSEDDLDVDIISSNTHSVINILSPFLHSRRDEILEWGRKHKKDVVDANPVGDQDLLYILSQFYFRDPALAKERTEVERTHGIRTLVEEEFTGISLQLFDPSKLDPGLHDEFVDIPACQRQPPSGSNGSRKRHLIINIDFAFGRQAEEIIHCLILLFRTSIRSVNVLGKAGGLLGQRGDILIPTHVLLQTQDILTPITNTGLDPAKIAKMSGRTVHIGPVLTIEGTLLQNRALLHYYRRFYHAVGLEMEGSYFARRIVTAIQMGLLNPDVDTRFIYYVSDIPLDVESTLAKSLAPWESIPSLYTTARVVLEQIFLRSEEREQHLSSVHRVPQISTDSDKGTPPLIAPTPLTAAMRTASGAGLFANVDVFSSLVRRSPLLNAVASSSSSVAVDGNVVEHARAHSGLVARDAALSEASLVPSPAVQRTRRKTGGRDDGQWRRAVWGLRAVNALSIEGHTGATKELGCGIDPLADGQKTGGTNVASDSN
ncbi:hypothetical protein M427DRAFT_350598 [Gonapodya prolifera JEL478]|uniref:Cyclic nucleotide-binding domain-containing protein n=1 Tax=Gonapodya prolifera (strain JEL478) TaxID=1344416 RepID=A0A139AWD2_GONPJ|nr:hypothetical protein M427DRAFT_350598 [Gonapodya prolifera JEL478]|eukprot:KXS21030.1 hypothetical protein M427DRAFT_350598 [Gonapodya prolifera JEL478]